jgi:hypothetical protein
MPHRAFQQGDRGDNPHGQICHSIDGLLVSRGRILASD